MQPVERGVEMKRLREAARLTQYQAGQLVGVRPQAVSQWEAGKNAPSWQRLRALDDGYGAGGALMALFGDEISASTVRQLVDEMAELDQGYRELYETVSQIARLVGVSMPPSRAPARHARVAL